MDRENPSSPAIILMLINPGESPNSMEALLSWLLRTYNKWGLHRKSSIHNFSPVCGNFWQSVLKRNLSFSKEKAEGTPNYCLSGKRISQEDLEDENQLFSVSQRKQEKWTGKVHGLPGDKTEHDYSVFFTPGRFYAKLENNVQGRGCCGPFNWGQG